jgi:hypothetical protein
VGRNNLISLSEQQGLLFRLRRPLRGVSVEQDEVRLGVLGHQVNRWVHGSLELRRRRHRRRARPTGVEDLVDLRGVSRSAVALQVSAVAMKQERELAVSVDVQATWGHGDPCVGEPDRLLDTGISAEETRGQRDVFLAGHHGGGVTHLEPIGHLLAFGHDVTDANSDCVGSREPVGPGVRHYHPVAAGGRRYNLNNFTIPRTQRDA